MISDNDRELKYMSKVMFSMNPVVCYCRDAVRRSFSKCEHYYEDRLIGYIFEVDRRYHKYYLVPGEDNIARFICSSDKDKMITDSGDYAILNTMGKYVDLCIKTLDIDKLRMSLENYQNNYSEDVLFEYY